MCMLFIMCYGFPLSWSDAAAGSLRKGENTAHLPLAVNISDRTELIHANISCSPVVISSNDLKTNIISCFIFSQYWATPGCLTDPNLTWSEEVISNMLSLNPLLQVVSVRNMDLKSAFQRWHFMAFCNSRASTSWQVPRVSGRCHRADGTHTTLICPFFIFPVTQSG